MSQWRKRLSRVPLLGGVVTMLGTLHEVYDTIGWTDPAYHSIRSPEERLEEARRVGAIGNPGCDQRSDEDGGSSVLGVDQEVTREDDSSSREG